MAKLVDTSLMVAGETCQVCNGTGKIKTGRRCHECGAEQIATCFVCRGTGKVPHGVWANTKEKGDPEPEWSNKT